MNDNHKSGPANYRLSPHRPLPRFDLIALFTFFLCACACAGQDRPEDPSTEIKHLNEELARAKFETAKLRYFHDIALAEREWRIGNLTEAERLLAGCPKELRNFEWHYLQRLFRCGLLTIPGRRCVAHSPDGKRIATGAEGNLVKLWDSASGKEVQSLKGHAHQVMAIAFSADGKRLASSDEAHVTRVWELPSGKEIADLVSNEKEIWSVALTPDGKKLATANNTGTATIWDVDSAKITHTLKAADRQVLGVAFSPDGKRLATAGWADGAKIWDVATGKATQSFGNDGSSAVAFSPDGSRLAIAHLYGPLMVFDSIAGKVQLILHGTLGDPASWVYNLAFSPDGNRLAAGVGDNGGGHSGGLRIWDATTGELTLVIRGPVGNALGVAFSPDGRRLASAWRDGRVTIYDSNRGQETVPFVEDLGRIQSIACSPDGQWLGAAAGANGEKSNSKYGIRTWNTRTGDESVLVPLDRPSLNLCVTFSLDSGLIAFGDYERVGVWDVRTQTMVADIHDRSGGLVSGVAFGPDAKRVASVATNERGQFGKSDSSQFVHVWDVHTGKQLMELKGHSGGIVGVAFSKDGKWIASAGEDGTARLWDAATGQEKYALKLQTDGVNRVAFSPDGKFLAAAGGRYLGKPGLTTVWDVSTGKEKFTMRGHTEAVYDIAWSPDGQRLATYGGDDRAILWDAMSGAEILVLHAHRLIIGRLAFAPNGHRLFASTRINNAFGEIFYWDATPLEVKE